MRVRRGIVGRSVVVAVACVASAMSVGAGAAHSASLTTAQQTARAHTVAYVAPWAEQSGIDSITAQQRIIGRLSPAWYVLAASGTSVTARTGAANRTVLGLARANYMQLMPVVSGAGDGASVHRLLSSDPSRRASVRALARLAALPAYSGIELDVPVVLPADRAAFTAHVTALATALHARHRRLAIVVPASTSADDEASAGYDLRALGRVVDEVRVRAYDYSWSCGGSGPIAPYSWVRQVVAYTVTKVSPRKVILGIGLYGYDWPASGCAVSRTWVETNDLLTRLSLTTTWDAEAQSPRVTYRDASGAHVVWFENARSTRLKLALAAKYHLGGAALWRLGGEDPLTWNAVNSLLAYAS